MHLATNILTGGTRALLVWASIFVLVSLPLVYVTGATEDFSVSSLVGSGTTPPTVPLDFTATPVATSQINLAWSSSTDDYLLSGYHVWRDDMHIATTTAPSYADTGLTASTTYTYYVTAFDSVFNISASSSVVSTTTLSPSPPAPTPTTTDSSGTTFGSLLRPLADELRSLLIIPQKDSVLIRYETNGFIRSIIRWGVGSSYEMGSLVEKAFSTQHETTITGLTPGTKYFFSLEGENKIGRTGTIHTGTFVTLPPDDVFPPDNVSRLTAVRDGSDIVLSWVNPTDPDLAKVRVVGSNQFYPSDTADGWVVYEGLGNAVRDKHTEADGPWRYYTVFSYDALGNISSGATVAVYVGDPTVVPGDIIDPTKNVMALTFEDFIFSQEGTTLPMTQGMVRIDGTKHLTIKLPYDRVPEHLKTILFVLGDSTDVRKSFSFLLRVNAEKTAYTGTLAPFGVAGDFPVQVSIFDYKTAQVGYTSGLLSAHIQSDTQGTDTRGLLGWVVYILVSAVTSYAFWLAVLLILLTIFGRRLMQARL